MSQVAGRSRMTVIEWLLDSTRDVGNNSYYRPDFMQFIEQAGIFFLTNILPGAFGVQLYSLSIKPFNFCYFHQLQFANSIQVPI